ncbi:MAG: hypothetical protein ACJ73V_02010 [Acidimicrobiia bacterium]
MTARAGSSPRVRRHGWGTIDVEGVGELRDAKLWPGGGRAWDWKETAPDTNPAFNRPISWNS